MVTPQHHRTGSSSPTGERTRLTEEEFWALWYEHQSYLRDSCLHWMKGNRLEADDALSGAMMEAYGSMVEKGVPSIGNYRAWFVRVARRYCVDLYRQYQRGPLLTDDLESVSLRSDSLATQVEPSPEDRLVEKEKYEMLRIAVESLPEALRKVMVPRAYEDMPFGEIAVNLFITPAAVRKRAQVSRRMIGQRFQELADGARGPRRAHDGGMRPDSERRVAEAIFACPEPAEEKIPEYAFLRRITLRDGTQAEDMVFALTKVGRLDQQISHFRGYMVTHPKGKTRDRMLADLLRLQGQLPEAVEFYRRARKNQPQVSEIAERLATSLHQLGDRTEAIQVAVEGGKTAINAPDALHLNGLAAWWSGDVEAARTAWKSLAQHQGQAGRAARMLVRLELSVGGVEAAQRRLLARLKECPQDREAHHLALQSAIQARDPDLFRGRLDAAKEQFPRDPYLRAYCLIDRFGMARVRKGEHKQISKEVSNLKKQLEGRSIAAHLQACWLYLRERDVRVREVIEGFVAKHPNLREAHRLASHWMSILEDNAAAARYRGSLAGFSERKGHFCACDIDALWPHGT